MDPIETQNTNIQAPEAPVSELESSGASSNKHINFPVLIGLIVLCICIVLLIILIINKTGTSEESIINTTDDRPLSSTEVDTNAPGYINFEITNKYSSDKNYSADDAVADFESALLQGSGSDKVYLAIYYANFVYSLDNDITKATNILKTYEKYADSEAIISYNAALRDLYLNSGDEEQAEYYNQKVIAAMPEIEISLPDNTETEEE